MVDESNEALRLLSLLENYDPRSKKDREKMVEDIRKAHVEAFRCTVDMDGNILLHEAVHILSRNRSPFHSNDSLLMTIIEKDPESAFKANNQDQLALHLVCERSDDYRGYNGDSPVIDLLLEINPNSVDQPDKKGRFPLHYAVRRLAEKYTKVSLRRIITPKAATAKDIDGHTPLHYVAKVKQTRRLDESILRLLRGILNASPGALQVKSNSDDLPIHHAAETGHLSVFEVLAERSAQGLVVRNGSGKLPMDIAVESKSADVMVYLVLHHEESLPHGADLSKPLSEYLSRWCWRKCDGADLSTLIAKMPTEDVGRALDQMLEQHYEVDDSVRETIAHVLGEVAKKPSTLESSEIAVANAKVEELQKHADELKQTPSHFEKQVDGQGTKRESSLEEEKSMGQEKQLKLKQTKYHQDQKMSPLPERFDLSGEALMKYEVARGFEQAFLNVRRNDDDIAALRVTAQSLNDQLLKMRTERSMAQNFLSILLTHPRPEEEHFIQVVQTLKAELAEIEAELLKASQKHQRTMQSSTRSIDNVDSPSNESIRKKVRVSLSPMSARDE